MRYPGTLAVCLDAWRRGEDGTDRKAGAFIVADTLLRVRSFLTPAK